MSAFLSIFNIEEDEVDIARNTLINKSINLRIR